MRKGREWTKSQGDEVEQATPKKSESKPQEVKEPPQEAQRPGPNIPLVGIDVNFTELPLPSLFDVDVEPV